MDADDALKLSDLSRRSESERRRSYARRPKRAADVVAAVIAKHGYAAVKGGDAVSSAWRTVVSRVLGDGSLAAQTLARGVRRGVLEVAVANAVVMQEVRFHKPRLLAEAQSSLPEARLTDLRFTVGRVGGSDRGR